MPPRYSAPPRKQAIVLIVDVNSRMGGVDASVKASGIELERRAVQLLLEQKLLFTKQDEVAILLMGTDETENKLADEDNGNYQHIRVLRPLQVPTLEMLSAVESDAFTAAASSASDADAIDAVLVAMSMLHERVGKLKFQKRIFLITNAAGPIVDDPEAQQRIEEGMRRDEIKLNVIGVGFRDEDEENDDEAAAGADGDEERKEGDVKVKREGGGCDAATAAAAFSSAGDTRTATQIANERLLKKFAQNVEGAVINVSNAMTILSQFQSRSVNQVTKFRGDLTIGTNCVIHCWSYGKTQMQHMPSLKKMPISHGADVLMGEDSESGSGGGGGAAAASSASGGWRGGGDGEDDDGDGEGGGGGGGGGAATVQMERSYLNKFGDREKEVGPDDRIKSFRYGAEQVPFSEEDIAATKLKASKGIQVLSFIPLKAIPRHRYLSNVDIVVAQPGDFASALALSALIHACYDSAKGAIVRYVKRENDRPLLGILIPHVDLELECFYFNQLPFEEDLREFSFSALDDVKITNNQKQAAIDLVRSLNLMTAHREPDGETSEALDPQFTFNPVLQRFYQSVKNRALDPAADVSQLDPLIASYITPDPSLSRQAAGKMLAFKAAFELKPVEQVEAKSRKRHWKDYYSSEVAADVELEAAQKRLRVLEDGGGSSAASAAAGGIERHASSFSLDSALAPVIDKIGGVDPVRDFQAMLARRDDPAVIPRAFAEMQKTVKDLVQGSLSGHLYDRALECVIALRAGCVQMEEAQLFHRFLDELKSLFATSSAPGVKRNKHEDFFNKLQSTPVLPIHNGEVTESSLSREEAENYYSLDAPPPPTAPVTTLSNGDADALFDSLE